MKTTPLPEYPDARSPAGADIRYLISAATGNMIHSTVPAYQINKATRHRTVTEFWYVLEGQGEIWRNDGVENIITPLVPGTTIDIPPGTAFQYRNVSEIDLKFICIDMPPWSGDSEASYVKGIWQPTFVPATFVVPLALDTPRFHLRPLSPEVVYLDYAAVMTSIDLLTAMFHSGWPHPGFTWLENLQDLIRHYQEFEERLAFAYTVLSPDEATCLGCIYINPPGEYPADARVHLWVRQSAYEQGLDRVLFRTVQAWLAESWPFKQVVYPGRREDGSWELLEEAG
jgi:mannose-6-phosphate isomerase-like protein (cupin superfamily)